MIQLVPLSAVAPQAVEALLDRAFGADRRGRTAYKVREGTVPIDALSFAAIRDGELAGTIQCWPVALHADDGTRVPMVMVGPIAVDPQWQQAGIGRMLTRHALDVAAGSSIEGADALMLIGDPEYYARFFGFSPERTGAWRLPGPFEARRLLALGPGVPDRAGIVAPRVLTTA